MNLSRHSRGSGDPITLIHGFTQTHQSWKHVVDELASSYTCTTIDAPGHGESTDGKLDLEQCAHAISEAMSPGVLVGYSMGARMALHTALLSPTKVHRLVLVSGTPGIENHDERAVRKQSDNELANHIEEVGVPLFLKEWLALPMFVGLQDDTAQISDRLTNTAQGLANSLRFAGTGTQLPLWQKLKEIKIPVLLIAGANDSKFSDIALRIQAEIPQATLAIVPASGHTVHLEQHDAFMKILTNWLSVTKSNK